MSKHTPTSSLLICTFPFLSMRIEFYWMIYESLLIVFSLTLLTFYNHYVWHITFDKHCRLDTRNQFKKYKQGNGPALEKPERETEQHHFCTKRSGYDGASIKCHEHLYSGVSDGHPQRVLLFCLGGDCLPLEEVVKKSSRPRKDHNPGLECRVSPQMEA